MNCAAALELTEARARALAEHYFGYPPGTAPHPSRPAPTLPARPAETSAPVSARRGGAGRGAPKSA